MAKHVKLYPCVLESELGRYRIPAELGRLVVPENRREPTGNLIELAFVRLKSPAARPLSPVVLLAGGPGGSSIDDLLRWDAATPWFLALREHCDVIALDQRGVGQSRPRLDCPWGWDLSLDRPGSREELVRTASERARAAVDFWTTRGVDLTGYTTVESADDIDGLRQALGYERVSLWGASYGSHLALATIRRHGADIDQALVALVEGPDHTWKLPSTIQHQLERIDLLVRDDPELRTACPDLLGLMRAVLERLERDPITVVLPDPRNGGSVAVTVGAFDLRQATASRLGDRHFIQELPARYLALAGGDFSWPARAALERRRGWFDNAMSWLMDCASGATAERLARIQREAPETLLGDAINGAFPDVCAAWGCPDLGDTFRRPLVSDVPTLFVSGTLDARTPVANALEMLAGFRNGRHLVIEGGDHSYDDLLTTDEAVAGAILRFLTGRDEELPRPVIPFAFARPGSLPA